MNKLLKKFFGLKEKKESHFDTYRAELKMEGLSTYEDLIELVKPLIKKATKLIVEKPSRPPENSQLRSHFGGQPYFEENEEWPKSKSGTSLDFIFQVINNGDISLPNNIKLIQFYYDFDEFPWDSIDDGWLVKIYGKINEDTVKLIPRPEELEKSKYCDLTFKQIASLPNWEGIEVHSLNAKKLSCILNEDEPWGNYIKVCEELLGESDYHSQIGGYPKWVQGESTPRKSDGVPMNLLFQIDSEDNADIMWGDSGLIYVFQDNETNMLEFTLQCY